MMSALAEASKPTLTRRRNAAQITAGAWEPLRAPQKGRKHDRAAVYRVRHVRARVRSEDVAAMTRVQLSVEATPGLTLQIDREQDHFMVVLGKFVVELYNGTISVGEYAQARWQEKPLLRVVTSD